MPSFTRTHHAILESRFSAKRKFSHRFEELIEDQREVVIILDLDPVTDSYAISSYATIILTDSVSPSAIVSRLYLSQCTNIPMLTHLSSTNSPVFIPANISNLAAPRSTFKEQPMIIMHKGVVTKKKYKPVAKKVRPVIASVPNKFRIERNIIGDPLAGLPILSHNPPPFVPTGCYTEERKCALQERHGAFLLPDKMHLLHHLMSLQNDAFAWSDLERGSFKTEFFPPVEIPVIPHTPWIERNILIPPGIYDEVCAIIRKKIKSGVYEHSNSAYRSRWFCTLKKDGKALRIVHSLEPLNRVTIRHSGVTPIPEHLAEQFAGHSCGAVLDLYIRYDE